MVFLECNIIFGYFQMSSAVQSLVGGLPSGVTCWFGNMATFCFSSLIQASTR